MALLPVLMNPDTPSDGAALVVLLIYVAIFLCAAGILGGRRR